MIHKGHLIALIVLALLTLGLVMVSSAGMKVQTITDDPAALAELPSTIPDGGVTFLSIVFSRPAAYALAAIVAMVLAAFAPVRSAAAALTRGVRPADAYFVLGAVALLLLVTLALCYVPGLSRERNGSHRWISLPIPGLQSIQPSEFIKWTMPALLGWYAAVRGPHIAKLLSGLAPALIPLGVLAAAVAVEDLGTGVLIAAAGALLLIAAGARLWHFALLVPPALLLVTLAILKSPYRVERILSFLDPYADPQGSGYHMIQSMATVAGGGLVGRGLGHGLQKFGYLPEDTTDFLFAVICEELGLVGAALVAFLFTALAWTILAVARNEPNPMLKLFTLGVAATVTIQALINLFVVTGLGPTKGIALPLVSAGGTGWILTAASIGLVLAVHRTQSQLAPSPKPRPTKPSAAPSPIPT